MGFTSLVVLLLLTPFTLGGFTRSYDNCAIVSSGNINIRLHWSYYSGGIQVGIESSNVNGVTAVGVSQKGMKGFGQGSGTFSDFWAVQTNQNDRQCSQGCVGDCYSSTDSSSDISFDKVQNTMEQVVSTGGTVSPMIFGEFTRNINTNDSYDFNEGFDGVLWVSWGISREVAAFGVPFNVSIKGASSVTFSRTKPSTCDSSSSTPASTSTGSDVSTGRTSDASTGKTTESSTGKTTESSTGKTTESSTGRTTESSTSRTTESSTGKTSDVSTANSTGRTSESSTGKTSELSTGKTSESPTGRTSSESTGKTSEDSTGKTSAESTGRTTDDGTSKTGDNTGRTSTGESSSGKTSTGDSGKSTSSDNTGRATTGSDEKEVYLVNMGVTTTIEITKEIFSTAVSVASSASSDRLVIVSFEQVNKLKRVSYDYNTSFYFEDSASGPSSKDLAYKFTALNGTSLGSNITVTNVNVEQTYVSSEIANNAIIYAVSTVVTAFAMLFC